LLCICVQSSGRAQTAPTGVLIMAHGGNAEWNDHVRKLAARVSACAPAEIAFGMAARASLQDAAERLTAGGVRDIVAVPLFVSSFSSVIEATKYLVGARSDPPPQLELFAKMTHDHGGSSGAATSGTIPVDVPARIRMSSALDSDPRVAAILA